MKTIPLQEAYNILKEASAIMVDDGNVLTYPILPDSDLEFSDENEFLYVTWTDEEGQEYDLKFTEGDNQEVTVVSSSLFLYDTEGDAIQISILTEKELEE